MAAGGAADARCSDSLTSVSAPLAPKVKKTAASRGGVAGGGGGKGRSSGASKAEKSASKEGSSRASMPIGKKAEKKKAVRARERDE